MAGGALAAIGKVDMHFARRQDFGIELLQAAAFALLVGFIYHYFGPSSITPPTPQVFGGLTLCALLLVATVNYTTKARTKAAAPIQSEELTNEQTRKLTEGLHQADWAGLEKFVGEIYDKVGCATWRRSNSEGENNFSLIIDRAGHKTAVMCKPWKGGEVTSPEIIEFSTELKHAGISRGMLVSLRECTLPALSVARTLGIDIVNREGLVNLFAACDQDSRSELLTHLGDGPKRCPKCDSEMVLQTATSGVGAGEQYWSCTAFPKCRCTEPR